MRRLIIFLLLSYWLTACFQPRGMITHHPSVNHTGHKAQKTAQEKLRGVFGRNMHGPNRFKRRHF